MSSIELDIKDQIATLTLNNPGKLNAIDLGLVIQHSKRLIHFPQYANQTFGVELITQKQYDLICAA